MAKSKLVEVNEKIAEGVVGGYKKIEEGVAGGYKKIEEGAVECVSAGRYYGSHRGGSNAGYGVCMEENGKQGSGQVVR